jgi:hypothetical protein
MPTRRHTRAQAAAKAKAAERKLNDDHVAESNKPPPFQPACYVKVTADRCHSVGTPLSW